MGGRSSHALRTVASTLTVTLVTVMFVGTGQAFASTPTVDYQGTNSGYAVYSSTTPPADVQTQFKVPSVTGCKKKDLLIAIGGLVEDSSGSAAEPFIQLGCSGGKAVYSAGLDVFGSIVTLPNKVVAGDTVYMSASMNSTVTQVGITVANGWSTSKTGAGDTAAFGYVGTSPVGNGSGGILGVPHFATFSFKKALINSAGLGTYTSSTGLTEYVRTKSGSAPPGGTVQIEPGTLGSSSFSLTFEHA
jgi:hypothetical protein